MGGVTSTITELTTPFINMLWFLTALELKSTKLFTINGLLIWVFWLFTRIGFSIYISLVFFMQWDRLTKTAPFVKYFFLLQLANISVLNVMWFIKITKGALK